MTSERWARTTEWPLTVAALVFLAAYAWEVLGDLQGTARQTAELVIAVVWVLFVIDYVVSLLIAERRWTWFITHLFDLAVIVLPMMRPLRLLRLVTLLRVLQRTSGTALRGRIVTYVIGGVVLLVFVGSLAILDAERNAPGAGIANFYQALWWTFVTITTVGYGDLSPVTVRGRLIAVGLMIGGIGLIGVVTGTLASWIVEVVSDESGQGRKQADRIEAKLDQLLARRADEPDEPDELSAVPGSRP